MDKILQEIINWIKIMIKGLLLASQDMEQREKQHFPISL